jgi:hypothetical protein
MFGRRPRPNLVVDLDVEIRGAESEVWITVLLENKGRGIARYPYLSIAVDRPYALSEYGIDDNGRFGLPLIAKGNTYRAEYTKWYESMDFGSQDGFVIHSGMRHPITKLALIPDQKNKNQPKDMRLRFSLAAEGIPLHTYETQFTERDIVQMAQR